MRHIKSIIIKEWISHRRNKIKSKVEKLNFRHGFVVENILGKIAEEQKTPQSWVNLKVLSEFKKDDPDFWNLLEILIEENLIVQKERMSIKLKNGLIFNLFKNP